MQLVFLILMTVFQFLTLATIAAGGFTLVKFILTHVGDELWRALGAAWAVWLTLFAAAAFMVMVNAFIAARSEKE